MAQKEWIPSGASRIDFEQVADSDQFRQFLKRKRKFLVPMTIFFMVFYFLLPICTSYTKFLNTPAIGDISWTWIFAFSQFVMVWVLSAIYVRKANSFDEEAEQIIRDQLKGE